MESVNGGPTEEFDCKELGMFTPKTRINSTADLFFVSSPDLPDWERFVKFTNNLDNGRRTPEKFNWNDLKIFTDYFREKNFIDFTQYCKVYRGRTRQGQEVTVKIWVLQDIYHGFKNENAVRLKQEVIFLSRTRDHPYLVKLIGYCCDDTVDHLGVVYDLHSVNTLPKLIKRDHFTWQTRMNVALKFASVIEFLQSYDPKYFVCNIDAAHVMLDQDSNPVLFDFALLVGGIFGYTLPDPVCNRRPLFGPLGFSDYYQSITGIYTEYTDVYSFGVVLLMLISKKVWGREDILASKQGEDRGPTVLDWAEKKYSQVRKKIWVKNSLVEKSLKRDPGFDASSGVKVTELAMRCVRHEKFEGRQPKIAEVVNILQSMCK